MRRFYWGRIYNLPDPNWLRQMSLLLTFFEVGAVVVVSVAATSSLSAFSALTFAIAFAIAFLDVFVYLLPCGGGGDISAAIRVQGRGSSRPLLRGVSSRLSDATLR